MTRSRLRLPGSAFLGALALVAAVSPARADDEARAHELFLKGVQAYSKGALPQAYELFIEAWGLHKTGETAGNLALVEDQLTRHREAAEHATYALSHFPKGGNEAQHKALKGVVESARPFVGAITLRVTIDHAAVTVDDKPIGQAPFPDEIFVDPGMHTLVASAPGCEPVKDSVLAHKGSSHLITLELTKCGAGTPPPHVEEPTGLRPITIAGIAATGAGLVLGAAFAATSAVKGSDANSKAASLGGSAACSGAAQSTACSALHDALVGHDTFAKAAVGTFVVAGALGAGTLIYTFAVPRAPVSGKAVQVLPTVGPGAGMLTVRGSF